MSELFERRRPRLDPVYAQLVVATVACIGLGVLAMTAGAQSPRAPAKPGTPAAAQPPVAAPRFPTPSVEPQPPAPATLPVEPVPMRPASLTTPPSAGLVTGAAGIERDAVVPPIRRVRPAAQPMKRSTKIAKTKAAGKAKPALVKAGSADQKTKTAKK